MNGETEKTQHTETRNNRIFCNLRCSFNSNGNCPLTEQPRGICGWSTAEDARRRELPIVYSNRTGTRRKFTGKKVEAE